MSGNLISLILDVGILLLLAGTIFYAARLSLHLKVFRDSRKDLEKLLGSLGTSIVQAEKAILGLQNAAAESGRNLQEQIDEAVTLSDELQLMGETGNNLAERLEKLAERNGREGYQPDVPFSSKAEIEQDDRDTEFSWNKPRSSEEITEARSVGRPSFSIRDPEFDRGEGDDEQGLVSFGDEGVSDEGVSGDLHSRAERELYDALQNRSSGKLGGRA